jgi:hypothetical protein
MPAYCIDTRPAAGAPGEIHDTKLNTLGAIREFSDGFYIYLEGVASTATGNFVVFDSAAFTTARLVGTAQKGGVAIASAAIVASKYGWYGYQGSFTATLESSIVSNAYLFATAKDGVPDDAVVKNQQIFNAWCKTAGVAGATGTAYVNRPWLGNYIESA